MPRYTVENNEGKRVTFEWASKTAPTDADLEEVFAAADDAAPGAEATVTPQDRGVASKAVGVLTAPVVPPPASTAAGTVKRVWDATKEMFVPSTEALRRFANPNMGQAGVSRVLEEEGRRVGEAVRASGRNIAERIATGPLASVSPQVAAAPGTVISTLADVASDSLTPSAMQQSLGAEALGFAGKEATVAARNKLADIAEKGSVGSGRRALGFIKSQLGKLRRFGGVDRANAVAAEMIKQRVITPTATADEILANAQALDQRMMNKIGEVITTLDKSGLPTQIDALSLAENIEKQLGMAAGKGATQAQKNAIKEIVDRVVETASQETGSLSFGDAQGLKDIFQKNGHWSSASDAFKADAYRRASGIVNGTLRKAIGSAGKEIGGDAGKKLLDEYLSANLTKGKARDAINALTQRVEKEAGNKFLDPLTMSGATAGGVASVSLGAPVAGTAVTVAAVVGKKLADQYGAQLTATGLDNLARLVRVNQVPEAVLTNPVMAKNFVALLNRMAIPRAVDALSKSKSK